MDSRFCANTARAVLERGGSAPPPASLSAHPRFPLLPSLVEFSREMRRNWGVRDGEQTMAMLVYAMQLYECGCIHAVSDSRLVADTARTLLVRGGSAPPPASLSAGPRVPLLPPLVEFPGGTQRNWRPLVGVCNLEQGNCNVFASAHPLRDHTTRKGVEYGGKGVCPWPPEAAESGAVWMWVFSD
jgi:hypothetical protein